MKSTTHTRLSTFRQDDLAPLVEFWNHAFAGRRNAYSITADDFRSRVLNCPAFDPQGLILAWHEHQGDAPQLIGLVHAFRPTPRSGHYAKWEPRHNLAMLYVDPAYRRQGTGSRLLQAAENWLYYCPVHVGGPAQPCYGTVEGPRPPFFGSSQGLGISVHDSSLTNFLAYRGYRVVDAGDVSMRLRLTPRPEPIMPDLSSLGLEFVTVSHKNPFSGREPQGRQEYSLWGDNGGAPYLGYLLVSADNLLQAHISCYPLHEAGVAAIAGFWVAPALRGRGLGSYLLDRALYELSHATAPWGDAHRDRQGVVNTIEVQTHLVSHAKAAALYEGRGFEIDMAWVNMVKECAVRGSKSDKNSIGLSGY